MHLSLTTDASDAGAVVEQECDSQCKAIAFFLVELSPAQRRYSTFSHKLLAIYLAVKHFSHLLEGRNFTVSTDHKPLTTAMSTNSHKYKNSQTYSASNTSKPQLTIHMLTASLSGSTDL